MAIEVCPNCTCRFAVGLFRCPQCDAVAPLFAAQTTTQEDPMPRITVGAGPTNADAQPGEVGYIEPAVQLEPAVAPAAEPVAEAAAVPEPPVVTGPAPAAEPVPQPDANLADPVDAASAVDATSGKAAGK